ncbi:hypothetical protein OKW34_001602 [Paraburkholderia youngii]
MMFSFRQIADSTVPNTGTRKLKTVTFPTWLYLSRRLHNVKAAAESNAR